MCVCVCALSWAANASQYVLRSATKPCMSLYVRSAWPVEGLSHFWRVVLEVDNSIVADNAIQFLNRAHLQLAQELAPEAARIKRCVRLALALRALCSALTV